MIILTYIDLTGVEFVLQWNLLIRTLENEDTCVIWTFGNGPKVSLSM